MIFNFGDMFSDDSDHDAMSGLSQIFERLMEMGERGELHPKDFVRIAFCLMWPAESPDSMDIRPMLSVYFAAVGREDLIQKVEAAYMGQAGPVLGVSIGVDRDKAPLSDDDHQVVTRAIHAVLRSGGIDAHIVDGRISITDKEGLTSEPLHIDIDSEVGKFRSQLEEMDGPFNDPKDPWSRWLR